AAGANVHLCRMWEGTPLHDAARFGLTRIADLLISCGADVSSKGDYQNRTPLHLAAVTGQLNMVDFLLSKGAKIDAIAGGEDQTDPATSLYWRQYSGSLERRLSRSIGGVTPLQMAANEGHVDVVKTLIKRGACLGVGTAIDLAARSRSRCETRFNSVITLLEERQQSGT